MEDISKFDPENDEVLLILSAGLLFQKSEELDEKKCITEFMDCTKDAFSKGHDEIQLSRDLVGQLRRVFELRGRRPGKQAKDFRTNFVERIVIAHARVEKARLVQMGWSTQDAHQKAAEKASARLGHVGINLAASTIFRRMENSGNKPL
jgi:hypothetical protein